MSKRTNNLKKRLRIEAERLGHRLERIRRVQDAISVEKMALEVEKKKAVALTIRLDRSMHQFGDLLQITTSFRPEMLNFKFIHEDKYHPASFNNMRNVSAAASMMAIELADKVRTAIIEFVETGKVPV
jgi:hypothetical protein